uniref:Uncharacterized protein n=1 Tax=Panagrolaimus sp. ES5 TaxID=591445 RepID=A0AC34FWW7_9BILA
MKNKIFIACFLLFLFWFSECQVSLGTSTLLYDEFDGQINEVLSNKTYDFDDQFSTLLSNESYELDDELFNETMTAVVLMTKENDKVTYLLSNYYEKNPFNSQRVAIAAIAIPVVVIFGVQIFTTVLLGASLTYNIIRGEANANAAERARIVGDERFQTLLAENKKLINEVKHVVEASHDSARTIVEKLDEVITTLIQQIFNEKVKDPMDILMAAYEIHIQTLAFQSTKDLNLTCAKHNPREIVVIMKNKAMDMYKQHLKKSALKEGFDLISNLEDGYLLHILANGDVPDNETITDLQRIVNETLMNAMEPRNYANVERELDKFNGEGHLQNIFIHGQEKVSVQPKCDFEKNGDGTLPSPFKEKLCNSISDEFGVLKFMKKHCQYSSLISIIENPSPLLWPTYHQVFNVINQYCGNEEYEDSEADYQANTVKYNPNVFIFYS